ncbi:WD-40 repeat-containing protein [Calothrix sp. NIES-2100]|uniref:WD40 repeat domain-containing protein n=1 Tax=Calothrix sp. NIES-2100 TaxID=1954172 RepID=UPI000B5F8DED|nr:WD-40 repeat-containing protein [Calothrix sp. NIES-2100]
MAEDISKYQSTFENEVKGAVVGDGNIIYNYFYYREEVKPTSVDVADESLPCPYRGLFHFGPNDADVFFGRGIFIEELYSATKTHNFIPVLGASGSGKSSVVLAGLVPKLQKEGHWQFTHFRPGSVPFYALAEALVPLYAPELDRTDQIAQTRKLAGYLFNSTVSLADVFRTIQQNHPNNRVLLIADQFEEIYTLCNNPEIRRKFLDCLLGSLETPTSLSASARVLVATMRADFLGNALSYRPFADVLQNADWKLGPMNREELTQVIEKPAQKLGVTFETGLVERILNDVENQPGNLPLLEFALTQLWNKRSRKQLSHKIYEEIGRVEGALARHADEKYGNLTDEEKEKVRRIFIQLVLPGEGAEDTRRVAMKTELGEQSWSLVKQLADARLVVTSRNLSAQETVEVVHEALIRNWTELREWMNKDRVFRAWQERLRAAKGQWEATNQDSGSLLRGAALAEAEEQLKERPEDLINEKEFIDASLKESQRIEQEKEEQQHRELKAAQELAQANDKALQESKKREEEQKTANKKLLQGGILLGFLFLAASGLGLTAWNQTQQAQINQAESLSRYSLSLNNENKDLEASVTAIKAGKILHSQHKTQPEAVNALQTVLVGARERNRLEGHQSSVNSVSFSPDGKTIATASADKTVRLWNLQGQLLQEFQAHRGIVNTVNFSPDGKTIATASKDNTARLWNLQGQLLQEFIGHQRDVNSVSFSPDGKTIATASNDNTARLWNLQGQLLQEFKGHQNAVMSVNFSPDGKTIATASKDNTARLWNLQGQLLQEFIGHQNAVMSVSFSPDSKTIATASKDKTARLWNLQGQLIQEFKRYQNAVNSVSFSPDGKTIATASADKTARLWNLQGQLLQEFRGHQLSVMSVSFSRDGKTIATASADKTARLWNLEGELPQELKGHQRSVNSVSFSPDGKTVATASDDKTARLWDLQGKQLQEFIGHRGIVNIVSFSPDGKTIATGANDKTARLWNLQGQQIQEFIGHRGTVLNVSFSPDGKTIATASSDKTARLWNLQGKQLQEFIGHQNSVRSVSFSPDGQTIATASADNTVRLWNLQGRLLQKFKGHQGDVRSVSFSPDGKTIATASYDHTARLWNLQGESFQEFKGHQLPINSVSFSPDGKTIVTASADNTARLWNLQGELLQEFKGHQGDVNSVSFSLDGKTIATASDDKTIKLWDMDLDSLMQRNCDSVRSYLTYNPLKNNPDVGESDRQLCDGISRFR